MPIPLGIFAVAGAGGGGATYEQIATQLVTSSVSSVIFSSIPATYKHLQIRFTCKSSSSGAAIDSWLRFNSDSGANYASHWIRGTGSAMSSSNYLPGNEILLKYGSISSNDSRFAGGIIDLLDYANTSKNKTVRSFQGAIFGSSDQSVVLNSGLWRNTTAVTSIEYIANGGATRTIESGSRFSLYGIKG